MGLMISFTADAGQDASIGASLAPVIARPPSPPLILIPELQAHERKAGTARVQVAGLYIGEKSDLAAMPDELEPRTDLKRDAKLFPQVDTTRKADPFVGLRPTFDTHLREQGPAAWRTSQWLFNSSDYLAFEMLQPPADESLREIVSGGATAPGEALNSPAITGSLATLRAAPRALDGATPTQPRAIALASATPAPLDLPIQMSVTPSFLQPVSVPAVVAARAPAERPNFIALIAPHRAQEERCLADAIYFEARGEPEAGQAAVAQVVLNRMVSGLYPSSICGVVYQNRHKRNACQFSFACDGNALRVNDDEAWEVATRIARDVLEGRIYMAHVGGSTHYHADYVRPRWAKYLQKRDKIGAHVFYQLRPGQL